ncbi:fibronectin type III domain-containing protein, partial [Candidatus Parcubacteria bacterium]|nr:fibronectin type III domain-containing protein [Candidatus Parcubacteria bacterium]
ERKDNSVSTTNSVSSNSTNSTTDSDTTYNSSTGGNGGTTNSTVTETVTAQAPAAPETLVATVTGSRQVQLSWNARGTTGEFDTFGIERKLGVETSSNDFSEIASAGPRTVSFTDIHAEPDTQYTYRVYAYRGGLQSVSSRKQTVTTWKLGDLNGDGQISISDFIDLASAIGSSETKGITATDVNFNRNADLNQDGVVDKLDFSMFEYLFNGINPFGVLGDINGDQQVSISDFIDLAAAMNSHSGDGSYKARGDINSDGKIDTTDFAMFDFIFKHKNVQ